MIRQRDAQKLVGAVLTQHGFTCITSGTYSWSIREGVKGWLGLNTFGGPRTGSVGVNPVIGVHHELISRAYHDLTSLSRYPGTSWKNVATLSSPIGYLMPQNKFSSWVFDGSQQDATQAADLVQTVVQIAKTIVQEWADLPTLARLLKEDRTGVPRFDHYPLAALLLRDYAAARLAMAKLRVTERGEYMLAYLARLEPLVDTAERDGTSGLERWMHPRAK